MNRLSNSLVLNLPMTEEGNWHLSSMEYLHSLPYHVISEPEDLNKKGCSDSTFNT